MIFDIDQSIDFCIQEYGLIKVVDVISVRTGRCDFKKHLPVIERKPEYLRVIKFETSESKNHYYRAISLAVMEKLRERGLVAPSVRDGGLHYDQDIVDDTVTDFTTETLCNIIGSQSKTAEIVGVSDRTIRSYIADNKPPKLAWIKACIDNIRYRRKIEDDFIKRFE